MMRQLFLCLALLLPLLASAADGAVPEPLPVSPQGQAFELPNTFTLVNDHAGMLPPSVEIRLARKLDALSQRNGTRIVLITVPSTGAGGFEGFDRYARQAFANSGLGEGSANGVLFLIDASTGYFAIRTGAGIGGAMPDSWVATLIKQTIEPRWNREHYLEAIEAGVDAMIARAGGEETAPGNWGPLRFVDAWKLISWGALGAVLLVYLAGCLVWRFGMRRPLPALKMHATMIGLSAAVAAAVALYPDPLEQLLGSRLSARGKGDFQILKLDRHPHSLAAMAVPGRVTVIALSYEKLARESSLETQLRDLASLRPDLALRMAFLDFDGWTTGELHHLFGRDIAILPYFMIFGADGHLIAADEGARQRAADLLSRWHGKEAYRAAGIKP